MDHYEGTVYSTADGIAGGPYGDPNRFDVSSNGNMTARYLHVDVICVLFISVLFMQRE